uniref:Uncharacterized protein n=1 Tax=Human respiratory syncytial virus TaxID=11250 RepID=A0A7S5L1G6_HRSV|nr:hypothetical protein NHJOMIDA_00006 [Human orthopneumovirus]QGV11809.1 hypothetical protein KPOOHHKP_00006 [Human orthopneumovirus]
MGQIIIEGNPTNHNICQHRQVNTLDKINQWKIHP